MRLGARAFLLGILLVGPGCATITGTLVAPVAVPISFYRHADAHQAQILGAFDHSLPPFFGAAVVFVGSSLWGCVTGMRADYGFFRTGRYGGILEERTDPDGTIVAVRRAVPFRAVFDPFHHGRSIWRFWD